MFHQSVPGMPPALEARRRDQLFFLDLPRDFLDHGNVQRQGLFYKKGNAPADGFEFNSAMAGGRHADEYHIGLHFIVHLAEIDKRLAAARLLHKRLRALQHQIAKARQGNVFKLQKVAQVVFANAAAADQRQLFHVLFPSYS